MEFVVYRGSWLNGAGRGQGFVSGLLRGDQMCCLGQACHQLGVPLQYLKDRPYPRTLVTTYPEWADVIRGLVKQNVVIGGWDDSDWATLAASYNDAIVPMDHLADKERRLIEVFRGAGHSLRFEDGVAPWFLPVEEEELAPAGA